MGTMSPPLSVDDDNVETLCVAVIKIFHNNNSNNVITHNPLYKNCDDEADDSDTYPIECCDDILVRQTTYTLSTRVFRD